MPTELRIAAVACGVLALDLRQAARELGIDPYFELLPGGLHNHPEELRRKLQEAIDTLSGKGRYDRIVIGYGICGRGTVGLHAREIPLAIPRVHDCIALFLGSDAAYRRESKRFPGTYHVSAGWYEEHVEPLAQQRPYIYMGDRRVYYDDLVAECGEDQAKKTFAFFSSWKQHYQRAAFIDTGVGRPEVYAAYAREMAERNGWRFERIKGDSSLLVALLTANQTSEAILVVPPGYATVFDARAGWLASCPAGKPAAAWSSREPWLERLHPADAAGTGQVRLGLGIDAGGTYTDAVLFDLAQDRPLEKSKALTTPFDFTVGIANSLAGLDLRLLRTVDLVAVSTTLATNAVVEQRGCRVGLLLMPPFESFDGKGIAHEPKAVISGRMTIGGEVSEPIDADEIRRIARGMIDRQEVGAFAVSGYGGSVNPSLELAVKDIIREATGCLVTCGHELSELLDFQTRARTAVMNARTVPLLVRLLEDLRKHLQELDITAPIMVVKGDGSLMSAAMAVERPVETILSGPAASVTGACRLTGLQEALVVDMGGTTTDTAVLAHGRVQVNESGCRLGGTRTHVTAMAIRTVGLGGDSLIGWEMGTFTIGPRRVAPVAWLGATASGTSTALGYLEANLPRFRTSLQGAQLLALTGHHPPINLAGPEREVIDLLRQRPYTVDELARHMGLPCTPLLPLRRLEDHHILQRGGLTPTDLLHQNGQLACWDAGAATRLCAIQARIAGLTVEAMVSTLMTRIVRRLALELMKRQLDEDMEADAMDGTEIGRMLCQRMLGAPGTGYRIRFQLQHPIIGIGAPISHFLPAAAALLETPAIIPEHADVANAIGAITGKVVIRRSAWIKPDQHGGFLIEGLADAERFMQFDKAEAHARRALIERVKALARQAGACEAELQIQTADQTAATARSEELFLERRLTALLVGIPGTRVVF